MFVGYETNNAVNSSEPISYLAIKVTLSEEVKIYKFVSSPLHITNGTNMISFGELDENNNVIKTYTFNRRYIVSIEQEEYDNYEEAVYYMGDL